jgi:hypothetical protein
MHRHLFGLAVAAAMLAGGACASDPTGDLSGTPSRIVASLDKVFLRPGDSVSVTAELRDDQGVPLDLMPEVTSTDPAIATVTVADQPPVSQRRFFIKGASAGFVRVLLTHGSVVDTISTIVVPLAFDGTVSVASGGLLDTVTIAASALVAFDTTDTTTVTINDGSTHLVSITDTEIKVLALFHAATAGASVVLHNAVFLPGVEDIELDSIVAGQTVDLTGDDSEPGNDLSGGAIPIALNTPFISSLSEDDARDFLTITLPADGIITVTVEFEGSGADPDIDASFRDAALVNLSGGAMGSADEPETWTSGTLTAGQYFIRLDWFDSGEGVPPHWYRVTVTQ